MPRHLFEANLWMEAKDEGALMPPCISEKHAGSTHSMKSGVILEQLER